MTVKRVAFATLGCKVNQFETADMIQQYQANGWDLAKFSEEADLYIINSCTVTGRSDAESRRLARRARRRNPDARIVVTGCYAQVSPDEVASLPEVDLVLGNEEKIDIRALVEAGVNRVTPLSEVSSTAPLRLTSHTEHTRAFLQIQNGCQQCCSYCIVPAARGPNRHVPPHEVLAAACRLSSAGYREIVLTGIHLGAYGTGSGDNCNLAGLLKLLLAENPVLRIRLGSIEPNELTDELLDLILSSDVICHHLHIPMQSGSDSVLERMGRCYSGDFYRSVVEKASRLLPDAFIAADIIAGFPGESLAEFNETCSLLKVLPLSDLHVFPYSRRPGTKADSMPGHLASSVITERAAILRTIAEGKGMEFRKLFTGSRLQVLGLKSDSNGMLTGLSRNYLDVVYPGGKEMINQEVIVEVTEVNKKLMKGVVS